MPTALKDEKSFQEAIGAQNLSVVHFEADWAEQCAQVNELLDTLSVQKEYSTVKFYSCPAEEVSEVAMKYNIEAVPTVILFRSGERVNTISGADPARITETVQKYNVPTEEGQTNNDILPLEEKLKALINKSKVMLFMKGNRDAPRCGFSKQIVEILNNTQVKYDTFDILIDEEIRQGLKTFSDWPTYPQLYVNGELIGGLDIVKEMLAAGELTSALNA